MRILFAIAILFPATIFAECAIKQFPLDERTVYEIAIGRNAPTTIMFPGSITSISGANISNNAEEDAPILISHKEGRYFFTLRALKDKSHGAVNIVYKNKTYVLSLFECDEPMRSVTFYEASNRHNQSVQVRPETLLSILDKAKSYHFFCMQYPSAVQQIELDKPCTTTLYKNYNVVIDEVFRFDPEDTLVFKVRLQNKSDQEIFYQPQSLAVRVAHNVYYASIADASGIMPPGSETTAYFAVTGKPGGGRANLSVKNTFSVIVMEVEDISLIVPSRC